jgi:hypothetical protein
VQVRYKLEHISRAWGDTEDRGEGRLALEKCKFGVIEFVENWKPGAAAPPRQISVWTRESYDFIDTASEFGFDFPHEGDDSSWLPSDLKLPFFFDTDVAEMQKAYKFTLGKSTRTTYTVRVTPLAARSGGTWLTAALILDRATLLPSALWLDQGRGETDVYRALEIKINEPIPDETLAVVDRSSCQRYRIEFVGPQHWIRRWLQPDRAASKRPMH